MKTKNEWKEIYSNLAVETLKNELRALKKVRSFVGAEEAIQALEELIKEKS